MVRIRTVEPLPGHRLRLGLTDGRTIERDLTGELWGPVFDAIREEPAVFAQVRVDYGTVVWPNGADLDPDVLIWGGPPPDKPDDDREVAIDAALAREAGGDSATPGDGEPSTGRIVCGLFRAAKVSTGVRRKPTGLPDGR